MGETDILAGHPEAASRLRRRESWLWVNPRLGEPGEPAGAPKLSIADVQDAEARWRRFAPLLASLFAELAPARGIIESPLLAGDAFARVLRERYGVPLAGRLAIKADGALPVAGSIKARGGIYAVLCFAEKLALEAGLVAPGESYLNVACPRARELFSRYELSVGSTGNLGYSIGVAGAALGFRVTVHMSREAREWKKARLRKLGVNVVEHESDYTAACVEARRIAESDPQNHFIDDENSLELFLGYSVAALRLPGQLAGMGIEVGPDRPLFVYLPCGVGGAPGGITFGLKQIYGEAVHCFFAEPTEAPCMLLGMLTGLHSRASVYDAGLTLATGADGLAVSRPSRFVGQLMASMAGGVFTLTDDQMCRYVAEIHDSQGVKAELSAAAGCAGPGMLLTTEEGRSYLRRHELEDKLPAATHLIWTTGGLLMPDEEFHSLLARARRAGDARGGRRQA
ncbi:MAG TPA: D-serine ammonia-lyase [Phycisphaerae bacterium]|nr:D-serine ammonia-lyase [Phycisphaerae bacterium]HUT61737.1 D-serine ammonia-lyase [Phycisphaerae bacterium]